MENGDYFETIILDKPCDRIHSIKRSSTTKTKSKVTYYKTSSGKIKWYVKVTGTFTYSNGTSKCISSIPSAGAHDNTWKIKSISGSKSENTCSATATAQQYYTDKPFRTITKTVTLKCSPTGVFS